MTPNFSNPYPTVENNFTNKEDDAGWFAIYYLVNFIFYNIAFLLGTPGNVLVIWITGVKLKTINSLWILYLAIADLICCVFLSVRCAYYTALYYNFYNDYFSDQRLYFSIAGCTGVYVSVYSSVIILTAMSIDRCISIMYPLWHKTHRTSKHVHITAAIIWVMSLILAGFQTYNFIIYSYSKQPPFEYILITILTTSFIIIITCYSFVCFKLKKMKRPNRSYRVITALIICFFICWGPYYIHQIIKHYLWEKCSIIMNAASFSLACFNSCINPIIYVFIGQDFRETLMESLPPGVKTVINKHCNQTPIKPESDNEEISNTNVRNVSSHFYTLQSQIQVNSAQTSSYII